MPDQLLEKKDQLYPESLRQISAPPNCLYVRGNKKLLCRASISIVGARKASGYGEQATASIASGLSRAGLIIVSGLAYGVDSWAHRAALGAGGKTVAVLASGLDVPLPTWQQELADEIVAKGGALVSEFAPKVQALKHHFLLRNRIIAGLSLGTIVVEARDKSGALVTANYALESNKLVFAVPGDIDRETSIGPNRLIKQGAVLVRDAQDVLLELPESQIESTPQSQFLKLLKDHPFAVEEVADALTKTLPDALATLSQLELDGRVTRLVDGRFALKQI